MIILLLANLPNRAKLLRVHLPLLQSQNTAKSSLNGTKKIPDMQKLNLVSLANPEVDINATYSICIQFIKISATSVTPRTLKSEISVKSEILNAFVCCGTYRNVILLVFSTLVI